MIRLTSILEGSSVASAERTTKITFLGHRDAEARRNLFFGDVNLIVNLIINRFKYYF